MSKSEPRTCRCFFVLGATGARKVPDRLLRDELWLSDRFLDLPTDSCRVSFIRMISEADDFGNLEGGVKRLFRMLSVCTQIKTEAAVAATLGSLIDSDLIRAYQVDGRDFVHLPRFKSKRWYVARKVPASPWCDASTLLGKAERAQKQALASEVVPTEVQRGNLVDTTLLQRGINVERGVGVGVGVGKHTARASPLPSRGSAGDTGFGMFWSAYPRKIAKANAIKAWAKLSPSADLLDDILAAVKVQSISRDWTKDDGQFIPHPATWLNARRWEDAVGVSDDPFELGRSV